MVGRKTLACSRQCSRPLSLMSSIQLGSVPMEVMKHREMVQEAGRVHLFVAHPPIASDLCKNPEAETFAESNEKCRLALSE